MSNLIILVGLQASGKSTWSKKFLIDNPDWGYVSKDLIKSNKQKRMIAQVEEALAAGRNVIVDNTNPRVEDREPLIEVAKKHGATISGYYFKSTVSRSIEWNDQRTGKAHVPKVAIYSANKKMVVPSYKEGFDHLFEVSASGGTHSLTPLC